MTSLAQSTLDELNYAMSGDRPISEGLYIALCASLKRLREHEAKAEVDFEGEPGVEPEVATSIIANYEHQSVFRIPEDMDMNLGWCIKHDKLNYHTKTGARSMSEPEWGTQDDDFKHPDDVYFDDRVMSDGEEESEP